MRRAAGTEQMDVVVLGRRRVRLTLLLWLVAGWAVAAQEPSPSIPLYYIRQPVPDRTQTRFLVRTPGFSATFDPTGARFRHRGLAVRLRFVGASSSARLDGVSALSGRANFLLGRDRSEWKTDVPLFGGIRYGDLYPGIDLLYGSAGHRLKSEFIVRPGADPRRIRWRYDGAGDVRVAPDGDLVIGTASGELWEQKPFVYQEVDGRRLPVAASYRVFEDGSVGFRVASFDRSRTLHIDPVLGYSTYMGGSLSEAATAIAVDSSGNAYVTGWTESSDFPTVSPKQGYAGSVEVFVMKLNAAGTSVVYATYLGGNRDDRGHGIAIDAGGNALVAGWTHSTNFPVQSSFQGSMGGLRDAFVLKLNASGNALLYSTYLGGSAADSGNAIAVDSVGNAYVAGETGSSNFPRQNAFQTNYRGRLEGFVAKLNVAGTLQYSTYLGGQGDERALGIAVDGAGAAYLTGVTDSSDFPTAAPLQTFNAGGQDAFVTKLSATGTSLVYSTYIGGSGGAIGLPEAGYGIAVDSGGNAYIAGATASSNFPTTTPVQGAHAGGGVDAFVMKLNAAGSARLFSTYLGGASIDYATAVQAGATGVVSLAGYTASTNFPTAAPVQAANAGSYDAFVAQLNPAGTALTFSTYLGGSGPDGALSLAVDTAANLYLAGLTQSTNFPTASPIRPANTGVADAFLVKIIVSPTGNLPPSALAVTPSSGSAGSQTFSFQFADANGAADLALVQVIFNATLNGVGACWVQYYRGSNELRLLNDNASAFFGPLTPGSAGVVQNSQCILDAAGSSVAASGTSLTLNAAITFKPGFAGSKAVYLSAIDAAGAVADWIQRGSWTVPGPTAPTAPTAAGVAPSAGSGALATFSVTATDPNGAPDIATVELLFNTSPATAQACYARYDRASNSLSLYDDAGAAVVGTATPGAAVLLQNSRCVLIAAGSSTSSSLNNLTVNFRFLFRAAFAGSQSTFVQVTDNAAFKLAWTPVGSWSVPSGNLAPAAFSVTPAAGSTSSQAFTFQVADPNGAPDAFLTQVIFNAALSTNNACWVQYFQNTNELRLINDNSSAFLGPLVPGGVGSVQNSQCILHAAGSSAVVNGAVLAVTLSISFKGVFAGTKNTYVAATDFGGLGGIFQILGTWTVPTVSSLSPPSAIIVSPGSGGGSTQTFTITATDPNGYQDIAWIDVLFNTGLTLSNACYVRFDRATNTVTLHDDSGTSAGGLGVLGGAAALQNSRCVVDARASFASGSGNNLTLSLRVLFRAASAGSLLVFAQAQDNTGLTLSWTQTGSWSVAADNAGPAVFFVSPPSGSGTTQTFSFVVADPNGASDALLTQVIFNSALNTNFACWIQYYRNTNELRLLNDNASAFFGPLTPGGSASVQNSQCILYGAGSSVSTTGSLLTLNVAISFKPAFAGVRNAFLSATDFAGLTTGFQAVGSWIVPTSSSLAPPSSITVAPASGSGSSPTYVITASDPNGHQDLASIDVLFNSGLSLASGCWIRFDRGTGTLVLYNDSGTAPLGPVALGAAASLANTQCILNAAGTSIATSGNNLSLTLAVVFRTGFAGARQIFGQAQDFAGFQLQWQAIGVWTVPSGVQPPVPLLVNPSSGIGASQTFSYQVADPNGFADVSLVQVIINGSLNSRNACWVLYFRSTNELRLISDDTSSFFGPLTPGGAGTVENSQCRLGAAASSVSGSGSILTVNLSITFFGSFAGVRNHYLAVSDISGLAADFMQKGTWIVP